MIYTEIIQGNSTLQLVCVCVQAMINLIPGDNISPISLQDMEILLSHLFESLNVCS